MLSNVYQTSSFLVQKACSEASTRLRLGLASDAAAQDPSDQDWAEEDADNVPLEEYSHVAFGLSLNKTAESSCRLKEYSED